MLYESGNTEDLAAKIEYAINHKPEMKQIAKDSQIYARDRFSIENYASQMLSLYDSMLSQKDVYE